MRYFEQLVKKQIDFIFQTNPVINNVLRSFVSASSQYPTLKSSSTPVRFTIVYFISTSRFQKHVKTLSNTVHLVITTTQVSY